MHELFAQTKLALDECDITQKSNLVKALHQQFASETMAIDRAHHPLPIGEAGRPIKPLLVLPKHLPKRKVTTREGRAALLHSIAHIEFNAINLALDAVYRFPSMPDAYYRDWLDVASEECYHFGLINAYLNELGYTYGDFPGHNGLWSMAIETANDVLVRMALVPRVMEARGLDVTPGIMKKFKEVNDHRALEILTIIERDEIGHVAKGSFWYQHLCQQRSLDPLKTFQSLLLEYGPHHIKRPFAVENRLAAGFTPEDMALLEAMA